MSGAGWGLTGLGPLPPQNGAASSPYILGALDLHWDNPAVLAGNSNYTVVGVNIYRSDVSDRGPYFRINEFPVGGAFYRDRVSNVLVSETVDSWVYKGDAANNSQYLFKTKQSPVVKRYPQPPLDRPTPANNPSDVVLTIDGVEVPVHNVFGPTGEVTLINQPYFDVVTEKMVPPVLPVEGSIVQVSYYVNKNHVRSSLDATLYYRLTTVVLDNTTPSGYLESDLNWCKPIVSCAVEEMDYIWREAVRRNSWILQQGGERVKVFVRRQYGIPCSCGLDPQQREYSGQPSQRCVLCYGSGFIGGYSGPFESIIAPDDAERKIVQLGGGRHKEHSYEVWMGPSPVVTQRDFIVKQTGEIYSIGAARRPSNRGNLLQQHFTIAYIDEQDIRYKVPIDGTDHLPWPQTRYGYRQVPSLPIDGNLYQPPSTSPDQPAYPIGPDAQTPMQTDKDGYAKENEQRGRSPVWSNQNQ